MDTDAYIEQLKKDGILILENFISEEMLSHMQEAFKNQLNHIQFNSTSGFQHYEMYRDFVEDLMALDASFVQFALKPELCAIVKGYISPNAIVSECRGWRTRIVKEPFHAWHKDGWYDKKTYSEPPKQLKAAIYLTDVTSGSFSYVKGSHVNIKSNPQVLHEHFSNAFLETYKKDMVFALGKAGTVVIFDTAGVHCQNNPNLSPRHAAFYTFNTPDVRLDASEVEYGRYGKLLINNTFVDDTATLEDLKFLGFFQKKSARKTTIESIRFPTLSAIVKAETELTVYFHKYVISNIKRVLHRLSSIKKHHLSNK